MKPKSVTTQMKALDEYILMVLFVAEHSSCFCKFYVSFSEQTWH